MAETNIPDDTERPIGQKVKVVQRQWFDNQTRDKQSEIIKPALEKAHPTNDDVKKAVDKMNYNYTPD